MNLARKQRAFTFIELTVSMFIMLVLLGVGFYSFNKYENYSNFDKGVTDIKLAFQTAHDNSLALPKIINNSDLKNVGFTGVDFEYESPDLLKYRQVYVIGSSTICNSSANKKSLGEWQYLPKGVYIYSSAGNESNPVAQYLVSSGSLAGWSVSGGSACDDVTPSPRFEIRYKDIPSQWFNIDKTTGLIYE